MTDLLTKLNQIDMTILDEVVQQDQGNSNFEITKWSVRRLSDQGFINPDGLWLFSGQGSDNEITSPWSIVLKMLERQDDDLSLSDVWHWQREFFLAQSGLTKCMPGPVKAPIFYRVDESKDGAWIWMEHIECHQPSSWALEDFVFAAHQLGTWNGKFLKEMPQLSEPWLARQHYRSSFPHQNRDQVWQFPLHQKYIPENIRSRIVRLWSEHEIFFNVCERRSWYLPGQRGCTYCRPFFPTANQALW